MARTPGTAVATISGLATSARFPWATTRKRSCRIKRPWPTPSPCATATTAACTQAPTRTACSSGPAPTAPPEPAWPRSPTNGTTDALPLRPPAMSGRPTPNAWKQQRPKSNGSCMKTYPTTTATTRSRASSNTAWPTKQRRQSRSPARIRCRSTIQPATTSATRCTRALPTPCPAPRWTST
ncbi:hypothetical protein D9M68_795200 [compost metagenome]